MFLQLTFIVKRIKYLSTYLDGNIAVHPKNHTIWGGNYAAVNISHKFVLFMSNWMLEFITGSKNLDLLCSQVFA